MTRALFIAFALALAGCGSPRHVANLLMRAQTPGSATGAGATLVGPGNSAAPSTQESERTVEYFDSLASAPETTTAVPAAAPGVTVQTPQTAPVPATASPTTSPAIVSRPRYVHEKVTTTIGQHQDAAPLIRAAAYASNWSGPKWIGFLCIFVGLGGWLYGVTHKETGYPLVFLKVAGCGVLLVLVGDNPLWLLVLAVPAAFYALQKLGLLRPLP